MLLPHNFKSTIAGAFYDKEISILGENSTIDAEGGRTVKGGTVTGTFKGNVRYENLKEVQKDYGLDYQIDIAITTDPSVIIMVGKIVKYANRTYRIRDVLPSDSHLMIVGVLWK